MKASLQLAVAELAATEAFYGGILDLAVQRAVTSFGAPEHLVLRRDDWEVIFVEEDDVARNHPVLEERLDTFPKGVGMSLHFRVEDLEGIYEAILEMGASEQSARMVAMKAASDNAENIIEELQLIYNKSRQAAITKELAEIVGGAAAV